MEVAMMPAMSPHADRVRQIAEECGAVFVRGDVASPADVAFRVLVVDLTRALAAGRLGPRVIAIAENHALDCFEVIPPADVDQRLGRALRNLIDLETLRAKVDAERETIQILNQIGYALSAIPDRHRLLDEVLTYARRALRADGGSIYLIEDDEPGEGEAPERVLRFVAAQNDTTPFFAARRYLPLDETSLAGFVATRGIPLNVENVRNLPKSAPYRPNLSFDAATGYRTISMLLVPLMDRDGQVSGVMALVNHKPTAGAPLATFDKVSAFAERHVAVARSIASQAAVALENWRLYQEIQALFDGFVEAAVTAIEARDPSTGGHSWRVAQLTDLLAREVTLSDEPAFRTVSFDGRELTELHYAALLHDFGKVGVREEVLLKAQKLYPWELQQVELRFRLAALQATLEAVRENLEESHLRSRIRLLDRDLSLVRRLNQPGATPNATEREELQRIGRRWHLLDTGPVLQTREVNRLCIPFGSLDADERMEIQRHVEHTYRFLKLIPWTRDLRNVPELAWAHHEKLDGTGYPRRISAQQIPWGARLMTIADIFDALTAADRPYKGAMTAEQAMRILRGEAASGKISEAAVELLGAKQLWHGVRAPPPGTLPP
jgi:HD-GYP domain-containing protein (c-di-GMP phosphodiesterase class II)